MSTTEPGLYIRSAWSPGANLADGRQGGLKLQCSGVVDPNGPARLHPHEVRSPDDPSQRPDGWEYDCLSPSSHSQARLRDLLQKNRGLERLREKIHQQRLDRKSVVTTSDPKFTLVSHRGRITRKICRVNFDPSMPPPTLRGLATKSTDHHNNPQGMIPSNLEKMGRGQNVALTDVGCHSDTHAMKEAQSGLGPNQMVLPSPTQRKNCNPSRTAGKQILMAKPCKPVIRGRNPAPELSNRSLRKSAQKPKPSNATSKITSSKQNIGFKSPISTPGTPNNSMSKKSPSPSKEEAARMLDRSLSPSKVLSAEGPLGLASGRAEDQGVELPQGAERCGAWEVREFMGRKERDRRRMERQKKEALQREEERRRARVQEVLHKQKMALNRAKGRRQNPPQVDQGVAVTGAGQNQDVSRCGREKRMPGRVWQGKGSTNVEPVSSEPGEGPSLDHGRRVPPESRGQRVEALRQAAVVLGLRVEEEAARLRAAAGQTLNPTPGLTGPSPCPECQSRTTSFSVDLPWSGTPNPDPEDTENMVSTANASICHTGVAVQGSAAVTVRASEPLWTAQDGQTPTEGPVTLTDAVEQQFPPEEGRVTPQSKHSDSSDNTDSTSKWSEMSGFFGHRELLSRLSLAMFEQSLREEELRARHHSALCRLREDAFKEKTQTEIAWLEHRRRCLRAGEDGTLADITKKQEEVVNRMRQEEAEMRHWQNLYRCGRQQRKLLLRQQKEVVEIRKSAAQLKQQLQEYAQPGQTPAEPGGSGPFSPEARPPRLRDPEQVNLRSPGTVGVSCVGGLSPTGGHGLPHLSKGLENNFGNERQDVSETTHVEYGRKSIRRCDLLLEGDVFQDCQTAGQDASVLAAQPGVVVDARAKSEPVEEGSLDRMAPVDSQQLGWGTFSTDTDVPGLRRALPSEDGWGWRRRGPVPDEMAPAEQGELRAQKFRYPASSAGHPKTGRLPPQKSRHAKGRGTGEEEEGLSQSDTMAMTETQSLQDYPTALESRERLRILPPPSVDEESGPPERVSREEESWSDESSCSGGPLRVRSLPNFAEVSWKSRKSVGSFASLPEFQRATAVCVSVSEMSGPSSDVEEDRPLNVEDGGWRQAGHSNEGDWELQSTEAAYEFYPAPVEETEKGMGNTVALNIHNDQRSQSTLISNNNCEIMPSSRTTVAGDCPGTLLQAGPLLGMVTSGPSSVPGSPGPDAGSRDTESSSTNDSLSETEEESEALSSSSECLISSAEEDPERVNLGTEEALTDGQGPAHRTHPSGPGTPCSACHETFQASPKVRQLIPEELTSQRESGTNNPRCFGSPWKPPAPEETLSEILSPVDEVLSYSSTELPPTVTDELMLPRPPPACEVITWTSDDGFPPPPEELCDPHPLEDPSIKSDDLPSLSDDPLLPVSTGFSAGLTDRRSNDGDFLKVDLVTAGYSLGQRSGEGQGKEDVRALHSPGLSTAEEDENSNNSDPLSSFRIGDRVLVCGSRPGHLRFKGVTNFASGHWAGVALDHPAGNHDGMFRGVRYFQCSNKCGVLVRAEDVSRLLSEQESDQETRADDPFSDEEPPGATKPPRDGWTESTGQHSGTGVETSRSQGGERSGGAGGHSSVPQMSRDSFCRELNNNSTQSPTPEREGEDTIPDCSSPRTCGGIDPGIYEPQREEDIHQESRQLQQGMLEAEENKSSLITPDLWNSMSLIGDQGGYGGPNYLMVGRSPQNCLKGLPEMRSDAAPLLLLEQSTNQTPSDYSGCLLEKRDMDVRLALCADPQKERVGAGERCINDLDTLVDSLMGKLLMEVVNEAKEVRTKYRGRRLTLKKENHIQKPQALGTGDGSPAKPSLNPNLRPSPPCLSDQWRCSLALAAQPRVRVEPHDPGVVYRLVAESVEALWCQTGGCVSDSSDAPAYLASEESRRAYRQVIFDLTSDIYHKALRCHWGTSTSPWELKETSSVSPVWSSRTSLSDVKATVLAEVRRELNLERTDVQTREMMQNLSKYRTAHRDRVDYVLIQELHKEEQQWVDYSLDQLSVKMQLTEDLFDILMQDTISVLNQIYTAPSGDSPPALQPSQSSLIP